MAEDLAAELVAAGSGGGEAVRYRLTYRKDGPARFASHLDIVRALERAARRARLPLAYTQGFNPHPRLSIAAPLAVGWTAASDVVDLELTEWRRPEDVVEALNRSLPRGIAIVAARRVEPGTPAAMAQVRAGTYLVSARVLDGRGVEDVVRAVERFRDSSTVIVERRGAHGGDQRAVDVRPLVLDLAVVGEQRDPLDGLPVALLRARVRLGSTANLKPEHLLEALAPPPLEPLLVHRETLELAEG